MSAIVTFFKKPFAEKGLIIGSCDLIVKIAVLYTWIYLVCVLGAMCAESLRYDFDPLKKLWWMSYCFIIFFGATWLSYIVFFVRDYDEEDDMYSEE